MIGDPPVMCDHCNRNPAKEFCVRDGDRLVDLCGRCHRKNGNLKPRRRDAPGQTLFGFINEPNLLEEYYP